jgi:hypothetical protein
VTQYLIFGSLFVAVVAGIAGLIWFARAKERWIKEDQPWPSEKETISWLDYGTRKGKKK